MPVHASIVRKDVMEIVFDVGTDFEYSEYAFRVSHVL